MKSLYTITALAFVLVACKPSTSVNPDSAAYEKRIKQLEAEIAQLKSAAAKAPPPTPPNRVAGTYKGKIARIDPNKQQFSCDVDLELRENGNFYYAVKYPWGEAEKIPGKYEVDGEHVILDLPTNGVHRKEKIWIVRGNQLEMDDDRLNRLQKQ